jgi:hypothetical protein
VCGIAPFNDMMLVLAYLTDEIVQDTETDDPSQHRRPVCVILLLYPLRLYEFLLLSDIFIYLNSQRAKRPELRIINSHNEEISTDALSLHGFQYYQANDYELDYFPSEDMFYVVSPKDLVLAKPRDLDDHISWLLERSRYEEALSSLQEAQVWGGSKIFNLTDLGERYLSYLVEEGM